MPSIHLLSPAPAGVCRLSPRLSPRLSKCLSLRLPLRLPLRLALKLALSSAAALSVVAVPAAAQTASASSQAALYEAALDDYEANRWPQAYAALARLADGGHGDAARIALLMLRHGRPLYGMDFTASARQRQHWANTAAALAPAARQANR